MTYTPKNNNKLTEEEWIEMDALRQAINHDIAQVVPEKMETFSEYLVRSLKEMGN
jgi:hypothetical protein